MKYSSVFPVMCSRGFKLKMAAFPILLCHVLPTINQWDYERGIEIAISLILKLDCIQKLPKFFNQLTRLIGIIMHKNITISK